MIVSFFIAFLLTGCGGSGGTTSSPAPAPTPSTANEWTWMSGSETGSAVGIYGTLDVASATNVPGARTGAASWIDGSSNLWLFGGSGYSSTEVDNDVDDYVGGLNDLWEFNPTAKTWTWVSGSNMPPASGGVYGTEGVASAGNVPGGREGAISWIDSSGNLWLFGGGAYGSNSYWGDFNDLWKFIPTAKTWTWVSGSSTMYAVGVYGTQGVASTSNVPGGREGAVSWTDSSGNLWLFGGGGWNSSGTVVTYLNDLWEFNSTAKTWTWESGSITTGATGVYGSKAPPQQAAHLEQGSAPPDGLTAAGTSGSLADMVTIRPEHRDASMTFGNLTQQQKPGLG